VTRRATAERAELADDSGNAIIEFVVLAVVLVIPLAYVVLTVFDVQRTAYAATAAAREAARVFVQAPSGATAQQRADAAATLAFDDQGLSAPDVAVTCSAAPCLTPGATITVTVDVQVALPFVPDLLGRHPASLAVEATHVEVVDMYLPERP
jgi:Flp pilus assembly protein TadG